MRTFDHQGTHKGCDNQFVFSLWKELNTPLSLGLWLRYKYGSFQDLIQVELDPRHYEDPYKFALDYQAVSLIQKNQWMQLGIDRKQVALTKALEAERKNRETNARFRLRKFTLREEQLLSKMSRKIEQVLGPRPPVDWSSQSGWGPGSTSTIKGKDVHTGIKMRERRISVTSRALPYISKELGLDLHWARARGIAADAVFCPLPDEFQIVDSNRVVLVPKNAKTDRVIAAEPTGNIFLQKALGTIIRKRLMRSGIDLDDQTVNQDLASRAFSEGLTTIDLSSASDSLCLELVFDVLPIEWANLLDALRVKKSRLPDGSVIDLEKFSSMGNGFTFELESLIFFAAASAVCEPDEVIGIYGDDIIVPAARSNDLIQLLATIGFTVNRSKTFTEGSFYESCGRHYFQGRDVTPFYQKKSIAALPERIAAANRLSAWYARTFDGLRPCHTSLPGCGTWKFLVDSISLLVPVSVNESGAIQSTRWKGAIVKTKRRRFLRILRAVPKRVAAYHADALAITLRFGSEIPLSEGFLVRDQVLWREARSPIRSWYS